MTASITNTIANFAFAKVNTLMKSGFVTPEILDQWEKDLHGIMVENEQKIGKARIRELLVCYIIGEFDIDAFGVQSVVKKAGEISDTCIRKMKNQRKKGFNDLKIVKAAK